jgi:MFS transporter (putative signal transducer)
MMLDRGKAQQRPLWMLAACLAGLYAAQGITGSIVRVGLPSVLRDGGLALDRIGLLYVLFLPWALKFLWSPLVDRYRIAGFGLRQGWVLICQIALVGCYIAAAFIPPIAELSILLAVLLLVALFAATQDIATDALAVERTAPGQRGVTGAAGVAGGYAGFLIGVGLWLPLYASLGWRASMLAMAACLALLTLPTLLLREPADADPRREDRRPRLMQALRNPVMLRGLAFLLTYQIGLRLGISLIGPFLVDAGVSLTEIGWLTGTAGAIAGLVGALFGGWIVARLGAKRSLVLFAVLNAVVFAGLALIATVPAADAALIYALVLAGATATALSFVGFYTVMMGWCSSHQAGTDFALLQSADAVLAILCGALAGSLAEQFGHSANFAVAAVLLILAALFTLWRGARLIDAAIAPPAAAPAEAMRIIPQPSGT